MVGDTVTFFGVETPLDANPKIIPIDAGHTFPLPTSVIFNTGVPIVSVPDTDGTHTRVVWYAVQHAWRRWHISDAVSANVIYEAGPHTIWTYVENKLTNAQFVFSRTKEGTFTILTSNHTNSPIKSPFEGYKMHAVSSLGDLVIWTQSPHGDDTLNLLRPSTSGDSIVPLELDDPIPINTQQLVLRQAPGSATVFVFSVQSNTSAGISLITKLPITSPTKTNPKGSPRILDRNDFPKPCEECDPEVPFQCLRCRVRSVAFAPEIGPFAVLDGMYNCFSDVEPSLHNLPACFVVVKKEKLYKKFSQIVMRTIKQNNRNSLITPRGLLKEGRNLPMYHAVVQTLIATNPGDVFIIGLGPAPDDILEKKEPLVREWLTPLLVVPLNKNWTGDWQPRKHTGTWPVSGELKKALEALRNDPRATKRFHSALDAYSNSSIADEFTDSTSSSTKLLYMLVKAHRLAIGCFILEQGSPKTTGNTKRAKKSKKKSAKEQANHVASVRWADLDVLNWDGKKLAGFVVSLISNKDVVATEQKQRDPALPTFVRFMRRSAQDLITWDEAQRLQCQLEWPRTPRLVTQTQLQINNNMLFAPAVLTKRVPEANKFWVCARSWFTGNNSSNAFLAGVLAVVGASGTIRPNAARTAKLENYAIKWTLLQYIAEHAGILPWGDSNSAKDPRYVYIMALAASQTPSNIEVVTVNTRKGWATVGLDTSENHFEVKLADRDDDQPPPSWPIFKCALWEGLPTVLVDLLAKKDESTQVWWANRCEKGNYNKTRLGALLTQFTDIGQIPHRLATKSSVPCVSSQLLDLFSAPGANHSLTYQLQDAVTQTQLMDFPPHWSEMIKIETQISEDTPLIALGAFRKFLKCERKKGILPVPFQVELFTIGVWARLIQWARWCPSIFHALFSKPVRKFFAPPTDRKGATAFEACCIYLLNSRIPDKNVSIPAMDLSAHAPKRVCFQMDYNSYVSIPWDTDAKHLLQLFLVFRAVGSPNGNVHLSMSIIKQPDHGRNLYTLTTNAPGQPQFTIDPKTTTPLFGIPPREDNFMATSDDEE